MSERSAGSASCRERTGGKQYRVTAGDVIAVEKIGGDAGGAVTFDDILLIGDEKGQTVGTPTVAGAAVIGTILEQGRGDKIIVFKKKRRKGYRRTKGHRQLETVIRITDVLPKAKKAAVKKARPKPTADDKAEAPAAKQADDAQPATEKAETKVVADKADAKPAAKTEAKEPGAKKPAIKKPATKKAAAKPAAAKAAAKKPAAEKPAAVKGAAEQKE